MYKVTINTQLVFDGFQIKISRRVSMYLYSIKLGEVYLLRTCDSEKFEAMLKSLEPIKNALTIGKPNWDEYPRE